MSSSTSSSRFFRGVAAFLLVLALLCAGVAAVSWDAMVETGTRVLDHRDALRQVSTDGAPELPCVVFLGDSTFLPGHAYPRLLGRRLARRAEVKTFWWQGFEPFHHYLVAGRALDLEPEVMVVVAQPRVFWRHEPLWYADLLTLLPPSELPRAVLLPFHERSVSVPRLVLASFWGSLGEGGEQVLRAFAGGRKLAAGVPGLRWLVPDKAVKNDPRRLSHLREIRFEHYGMPIYEGHPALRALAATVEQGERRGARTLVLVSPIPVALLRDAGLYDEANYAKRIDAIRRAVEGEGGELLDLHAILGTEDFTDEFGHMAESGSKRVALVLETWLRGALAQTDD